MANEQTIVELPADLLHQIDDVVDRSGSTRAQLIVEAVEAHLNGQREAAIADERRRELDQRDVEG